MPSALRGGTETFWREWGQAPGALLLHCSLAHSGAWAGLVERLGIAAQAPDFPAHGRSGPRIGDMDFAEQSLRVAKDFLGPEPRDIIGHSFGATVALRIALEWPEAVRRLVLIEPVLFAAARGRPAFDAYVDELQHFNAAIAAGDFTGAARRFTAAWGTGVAWEEMREAQRTALADQIDIIPAQDGAIFKDIAGLLRPGRLEALKTPVLLLEGGKSPAIIGAVNAALAARIPDARRQVVVGAAHMLPITHPGEAAALIGGFLGVEQPEEAVHLSF